jgi:hypothetical protein
MIQTMESKADSRAVAARVAMYQLEALGAECFDIGVKRINGTMILREGWGAKQVLKSLLWLRRENLNRGHIYIRPRERGRGAARHRRLLRVLQPPTVASGAGLPRPAPGLRRSAATCQFGAG